MNPTKKTGEGGINVLWKGKQFLLHYWRRRVTLVIYPVVSHE